MTNLTTIARLLIKTPNRIANASKIPYVAKDEPQRPQKRTSEKSF